MESGRTARRRQQEKELKRAKDAAVSGDPEGAIAALHGGSYLKGLTIDMKNRWQSLPGEDVEDAVAEAVQTFFFSVRDGKRVADIGPYLWKAAFNGSAKISERRRRERSKNEVLEHLYEGSSPSAHHESVFWDEGAEETEEGDREETFDEAVAIARRLLPRLGQTNMQRVMAYIIEVVEKDPYLTDLIDIPNSEIAEALGLSVDAAKQNKSRGFRRLVRVAKEEGLVEEDFDLSSLVSEGVEDEEPEE